MASLWSFHEAKTALRDIDDEDDKKDRAKCLTMCSEEEMLLRQRRQLIHPIESDASTSTASNRYRRADRRRMVKCYTRPAAGVDLTDPTQLRPYPILLRTVRYLLCLSESETHPWPLVYDFVVDRLRACRQDIVIQRMPAVQQMTLLQEMLPFYFSSAYRCESELDGTQQTFHYDQRLHQNQIQDCIATLTAIYSACFGNNDKQMGDNTDNNNSSLGRCLCLLYGANLSSAWNDYFVWRSKMSSHHRSLCWSVLQAVQSGNFVQFFRVFRRTDCAVVKLAMWFHCKSMRQHALKTISAAYKSKTMSIPLEWLKDLLDYCNVDDVGHCLSECGYQPQNESVVFWAPNIGQTEAGGLKLDAHWNRCNSVTL